MNNDTFFYQDGGKTVGPVTMTDLKGRIKDGKVRLFDLILKEGDAAWRMALEHGEFKDEFKDKSKSSLREKPWVCLQRKNPDGFEFITTGPFAEEEVRESLMAGKISYTDYVWRTGFSEWKRIGLVEDFNPRLRRPAAEPDLEIEGTELIQNVVEMKRPKPELPELPPPEAGTDDLTKDREERRRKRRAAATPPPLPEIRKPADQTGPITEANLASVTSISTIKDKTKRRRKNVPWLDWGIVAILVVVLGAVALVLSRNIKRQRTLEVPATVVETVPPQPSSPLGYDTSELDENAPEPAEDEPKELPGEPEPEPPKAQAKQAPPPPPPKKIAPKAPTELTLNVQNRSQNARIDVRSNGTKEYPVYVQFVGVPGHVTSGPSFYRYIRMRPTGDPQKPLDLSQIKLPQGRFIVRVSSGDLKKEAKVNVGVNDPQYKQSIGRVRKLHAYAIWSERLKLLNLSSQLVTRITQASGAQKFSAKGFEALNQVRLVNGYKYALFDDWFELKNILAEAQKQPSAAVAAKAKRVFDKMVAYTVWK